MISLKVAFTILILVIIAGTGALAVSIDVQTRDRKREFIETHVQSLQFLSLAIAPSVAAGRHDRVQTALDNIVLYPSRFPDIRSLEVVGRDDRVIADLDPRRFNMKAKVYAINPGEPARVLEHRSTGKPIVDIVVPVRSSYLLGFLHATLSEDRLEAPLAAQRNQAALFVLGTAALLAFALYWVLQRIVGQRVVRLADGASHLRSGDLDARVVVDGDDEIGVLAETLNQMADVIKSNTANLEAQVAERTASLQRANQRLEQLAMTDALTALFNRRHFEERAARDLEVAKRAQRSFAVVVLDVDEFKQVNDRFGHLVGDTVLQGVSRILADTARSMDLVARIGGEEFAIAMPDATADEAIQAAERIRKKIAAPEPTDFLSQYGERVTASFGVAAYPDHGKTLRQLINAADHALYNAKQSGRNRTEKAKDIS